MSLPAYQREDIKLFIAAEPRLAKLTKKAIASLYGEYSNDVAYAGWLTATPARVKDFVTWCYETPVARLSESQK